MNITDEAKEECVAEPFINYSLASKQNMNYIR